MTRFLTISVAFLSLAGLSAFASDQGPASPASSNQYMRLLKASELVKSFQENAAGTARTLAGRRQGSDAEFIRFLTVVSTADLSDVKGCLADLYKDGLTTAEASELSAFFESPIGIKLLARSKKGLVEDLEQGSHAPASPDTFTSDEREQLKTRIQSPVFTKYGRLVASREFGAGTMQCMVASKAVQRSGIKP